MKAASVIKKPGFYALVPGNNPYGQTTIGYWNGAMKGKIPVVLFLRSPSRDLYINRWFYLKAFEPLDAKSMKWLKSHKRYIIRKVFK